MEIPGWRAISRYPGNVFLTNNIVSREPMRPLQTAIAVGGLSAVVTWLCVYAVIHEPTPRRLPDGSQEFVISCPGDDDDLTALLWASGAYILTFTPTLLLLQRRTRKDVFTPRQFIG
jgi:hypothetical protein